MENNNPMHRYHTQGLRCCYTRNAVKTNADSHEKEPALVTVHKGTGNMFAHSRAYCPNAASASDTGHAFSIHARPGKRYQLTFSSFLMMEKMKAALRRQIPASTPQIMGRGTFQPQRNPGIITS